MNLKTEVKITSVVEKEYLDAASRVMKKNDIRVNDLHALMSSDLKTVAVAADNVHFTKAGSKMLGQHVAKAIEKVLKANN